LAAKTNSLPATQFGSEHEFAVDNTISAVKTDLLQATQFNSEI
jgi:hypothetical protein